MDVQRYSDVDRSVVIEIHDTIMFVFHLGLPHANLISETEEKPSREYRNSKKNRSPAAGDCTSGWLGKPGYTHTYSITSSPGSPPTHEKSKEEGHPYFFLRVGGKPGDEATYSTVEVTF